MRNRILILLLLPIGMILGCGQSADIEKPILTGQAVSYDRAQYELQEEPAGVMGVIAAREEAEQDQELVVVGRVSDRIEGLAAFTLLDASMSLVSDGEDTGDDEICTGDCCASERAACTMLVKILDQDGYPLSIDSQQLLGFSDSDMLVVKGRVIKDESANISLIADGVYIRR
ncbi:MAG: hypothetical protein ABGX16_11235 [Pirellulales bacterium]